MNPRLPDVEGPEAYEPAIARARAGECAAAIAEIAKHAGSHQHREVRGWAAEALARVGRIAETQGDLESAERAHREAARIAPQFPDVHYRLACVRLAMGKRVEARRDLVAALRIHPRYVAARVELALLDAREGLLGEALDALRQLGSDVQPEAAGAFDQGVASLADADWQRAEELLRSAVRSTENELREFQERRARQDRAGALQVLRDALTKHPEFADLHYELGAMELEDAAFDDAIGSFARALEIHPDFHAARLSLARALHAAGSQAQAEEQVALILQADPTHPQALELSRRWSRPRRRHAAVVAPSSDRTKSP